MNLNIDRLSWWQIFLLLIVCIAALLGLFVLNAWILSIVWNWVMVSVFSLPFLNIAHAMGVLLISDILIGYPISSILAWYNTKA